MDNNFSLLNKLFPYKPTELPVTYSIGGVKYVGIPDEFNPEITLSEKNNVLHYEISAKAPHSISLLLKYDVYKSFPVIEWTLYLQNDSTENSPIISDFKSFDGVINGSAPRLLHGNGDNFREDGYTWYDEALTEEAIIKHPLLWDGNSCMGSFPYMRLIFSDYLVNIAVGWSAAWRTEFSLTDNGAKAVIGQNTFRSYLKPGERVRTPSVTFMVSDSQDHALIRNMWRRWYFKHVCQKQNGQPLKPKFSLHHRLPHLPEFCGATEENQLTAIETYVKREFKPDVWWIDAGWFRCEEQNVWKSGVGNFFADPERFPNGLKAVGELCKKHDIDFLMWMESERVHIGTLTERTHPEYLLYSKNSDNKWYNENCLIDLSKPEACDFLIDTVDGLIKEFGLTVYRQDFNYQPMHYWDCNQEPDREGMLENLHIQGLYRFWDTLKKRNPHIWIDNCAMGGRRNDIELMRRAVPLHYTDMGYGKHPVKQGQFRQMFEWIPYFGSSGIAWDQPDLTYDGNKPRKYDGFSFLTIMTTCFTSGLVPYDCSDEELALSKKYIKIWKKAANITISSDYYPLTITRRSDEDWYASQFDDPENKCGLLHFIRNIKCEEDSITVALHVDEKNLDKTFVFTDHYADTVFEKSGRELSEGFTYTCPKRSGTLMTYIIR